jgi:hypothetical protein
MRLAPDRERDIGGRQPAVEGRVRLWQNSMAGLGCSWSTTLCQRQTDGVPVSVLRAARKAPPTADLVLGPPSWSKRSQSSKRSQPLWLTAPVDRLTQPDASRPRSHRSANPHHSHCDSPEPPRRRTWLYDAAKAGRIPAIRIGGPEGPLRFVPEDIQRWIDDARTAWLPGGPAPPTRFALNRLSAATQQGAHARLRSRR